MRYKQLLKGAFLISILFFYFLTTSCKNINNVQKVSSEEKTNIIVGANQLDK